MRLPLRKVYRAFPELDRFSDEECERYVLQARAQRRIGPHPYLVGVGVAFACLFTLVALGRSVARTMRTHAVMEVLVPLGTCIVPAALGMLAGLAVRDWLLRRALRKRIDNARCTTCRHSLLGLPLLEPRSETEAVRCPECGSVMVLERLGLTAADLMPRKAGDAPGSMSSFGT